MPVRTEYTVEFKEQAVRFVFEEIGVDEPRSAAVERLAPKLNVRPATLMNCVKAYGDRTPTPAGDGGLGGGIARPSGGVEEGVRNSRFSLRNRRSSARSDSDSASGSPARLPASRAALTQFHSVPSAIPSERATSAIGRPDVSTSFNASRRNWSGYFCGRPVTGSFYTVSRAIRCPAFLVTFRLRPWQSAWASASSQSR